MQYIKNEWIKIWAKKTPWIMLIILLGLIALVAAIDKYYAADSSTKEARLEANEALLNTYKVLLKMEENTEADNQYYNDQLVEIQYRIDNDLPSPDSVTFLGEMYTSISLAMSLITIFSIMIAASIISSEFKSGTIKMLLTRPVARWKILLSKLVTTILISLALLLVSFLFSTLLNVLLFGMDNAKNVAVINGQFVYEDEITYIKFILYKFGSLLMMIIFAFMIGSLFSSSTLAVTLSLVIYLMKNTLTMFLAKFKFAKYIWFTNDLSQYNPKDSPIIEDLTLSFSLTVNIVYGIAFLLITFITFIKRDITA